MMKSGLLPAIALALGAFSHGATFEVLKSFEAGPKNPTAPLIHAADGNFYGPAVNGIARVTSAGAISLVKTTATISGSLIEDAAGNLYGATSLGGVNHEGSIFKITPQGTETVLASFGGAVPGTNPRGPLALDAAGNLYGVTTGIQDHGTVPPEFGTVFKITPGGVFTTLFQFTNGNGAYPNGGLVPDGAGGFLGTTYSGGASGVGTIFRVLPDGTHTLLASFSGAGAGALPGGLPDQPLAADGAGNFYGVTGPGFASAVFRVNASGTVDSLGAIPSSVGWWPRGPLVREPDGNFLGVLTYSTDGPHGYYRGTIFRVTPGGVKSVVAHMPEESLGGDWPVGLTSDGAGGWLGVAAYGGSQGLGALFRLSAAGQYAQQISFPGGAPGRPTGSLVADVAGNLFATTAHGGPTGDGTIFKITPAGDYTTLAEFTGASGAVRGMVPFGTLAMDGAGTLYGTTSGPQFGTVFKITPAGALTTLHEFDDFLTGRGADYPPQGVVLDAAGKLVGSGSSYGGFGDYKAAFIYEITQAGTFTFLGEASNNQGPGGPGASGRVALDPTGNVISGSREGDTENDPFPVFRMTPGSATTTIYRFSGNSYGGVVTGITRGPDGSFYGAAANVSGITGGILFKISPAGAYSQLAALPGSPEGELIVDETGNLFGAWVAPGTNLGTIIRVSPRGIITQLGTPPGLAAGDPVNGVIRHADGALYGSTASGGNSGGGMIYRLRSGPTPTTQEAANVTMTSATLRAKVNPHGEAATVSFEYGPTPALGSETVATAVGAGTAFVDVDTALTGLDAGRTYFFRAKAVSASGTQSGDLLNTSATYDVFGLWKIEHFGNPARGDLDDPDGDGVPLIAEYAFGLSPNVPDAPRLVPGVIGNRLTITFQVDASHTGISIAAEVAFSLDGPWVTASATSPSGATGIETITLKDYYPIYGLPQRFLRLRITR